GFVRDGENGFLVAPGDISALSRAWECLVRDDELRSRMGVRAATDAQALTWEANAERIEADLSRVARAPSRGNILWIGVEPMPYLRASIQAVADRTRRRV